ncbi:hypothetical protein C1645_827834 [Glomus cerebriforme]|uniref:Apple protein n=1 Tax=Glomus cerebriforme TaxID=658196 RepID=A0A397SNZ7_9GLOM|nr:hypothetical protein C1645_827834 [Glomus cerebriforme]
MNKFILSSFLLLSILLEIVSSDLSIVSTNNEFKPSTELRGIYSQPNNKDGGYHKAEIYFKTKVPSLNPDQSGVKNVDCNDGNKITLSLNDKNAIEQVKNNWPDKVMLLISHKWKCFGKPTTQFFMIKNKIVDVPNKKVTFTAEKCDVSDFSKEFLIDLSWVNGKKRSNARHRLNRRLSVSLPKIDVNNKISLNVLFNDATGQSSKPNFPFIDDPNLSLLCTNCFMKGDATISMKLGGKFTIGSGINLSDASVTLNGNAFMNLDLSFNGTIGDVRTFDVTLLTVPILGSFGVPGVFNIGPSINLIASTKISTKINSALNFGGEISLANFNANAQFVDITQPSFVQSGFTPVSKLHDPNFDLAAASVDIAGSIKPQLSFGLDVLNGKFKEQFGFQIVGTLDNNISIGNTICTGGNRPRLETNLTGNLDFFANNKVFPIVDFPSLNLLDRCL